MVPIHPIDIPVAHRVALDRAAEMILAAERPLIMIGGCRQPPARPRLASRASYAARGIPFFTTQMGKGTVPGGIQPLHGHRGIVRARLRARGDRQGRPDHRDRSRHGREAALHHGPERAEGHPRQLHTGQRRTGLSSPMPKWSATSAPAWNCWPTGSKASCRMPDRCCRCAKDILAHIADRADEDRWPVTPQRLVHDVRKVIRRTASSALDNGMYKIWFARNYRTHRRQHAAARQCAGHHGRRAALGDDGGDALSATAASWRCAATAAS